MPPRVKGGVVHIEAGSLLTVMALGVSMGSLALAWRGARATARNRMVDEMKVVYAEQISLLERRLNLAEADHRRDEMRLTAAEAEHARCEQHLATVTEQLAKVGRELGELQQHTGLRRGRRDS